MQQPLERYGVVVLLFLVALVAVAIFWEDGSGSSAAKETLAAAPPSTERSATPEAERAARRERERLAAEAARTAPATPRSGLELSREADTNPARDLRTSSTTYGATPRADVGPSPGTAARTEGGVGAASSAQASTQGLSTPEQRGGASSPSSLLEDRVADRLASGTERDSLARDLQREADARASAERERPVVASISTTSSPASSSTSNGRKPDAAPGADKGERVVTVRDGESLWRIAERELDNGTRWKEIATLNSLRDSDMIIAGMKLRMPAKSGAASSEPTRPEVKRGATTPLPNRGTGDTKVRLASVPGARPYVVRSGDSLGVIAQRELGSVKHVAAIKELNGLTSDLVLSGATLLLPEGRGASSAVAIAAATPPPVNARAPRAEARGEFYVR